MPASRDYQQEFKDRIHELARTHPHSVADMYIQLRLELTKPPEGWFNFGTHILPEHRDIRLDWWGTGDDGMPIWERPIQEEQ